MTSWIFGIFSILAALLGLELAAHAIDIGMTTFGFGLFGFGIFFLFFLINDHGGEAERAKRST